MKRTNSYYIHNDKEKRRVIIDTEPLPPPLPRTQKLRNLIHKNLKFKNPLLQASQPSQAPPLPQESRPLKRKSSLRTDEPSKK